jgi:hypothetical protein
MTGDLSLGSRGYRRDSDEEWTGALGVLRRGVACIAADLFGDLWVLGLCWVWWVVTLIPRPTEPVSPVCCGVPAPLSSFRGWVCVGLCHCEFVVGSAP